MTSPERDRHTRVLALVDAHSAGRARIEARVRAVVERKWGEFDGWYQEALVEEIAAEVAAQVAAGQAGVASLTDAYLAQVATVVRGRSVSPVGAPSTMGESLRAGGVTLAAVQARAAAEFRWQASKGVVPVEARRLAVQRAQRMAVADLGLAFQQQTHRFMVETNADGFRRVIRPERSRLGTCGLCVAASNRVYYKSELMPLHDGCHCGVVEVGGDIDEGRIVNDEEYAAIAGEAKTLRSKDLRRVQVQVSEHGELGPVLTDARHSFRGPQQVAAA